MGLHGHLHPVGTPEHTAAKYLMLYEWQFLERMLVYESRELEIILLSSSNTMIFWLQQRRVGQNLDALKLKKEQMSEAMRRVKEEQAQANTRLEQLDKEVRSWITDYWGLTGGLLEARTRMFSDHIRGLWGQRIADMKGEKHPPAPSEYDDFLTKTLNAFTSTQALREWNPPNGIWEKKRSQFEEAQWTNAAQRDAMTEQLHNDIQTTEKWLELFRSAVLVAGEQGAIQ